MSITYIIATRKWHKNIKFKVKSDILTRHEEFFVISRFFSPIDFINHATQRKSQCKVYICLYYCHFHTSFHLACSWKMHALDGRVSRKKNFRWQMMITISIKKNVGKGNELATYSSPNNTCTRMVS